MRFKIISVGWSCAQFMERTMASIEKQTLDNWDVGIAYDPSDDKGADIIRAWCDQDPERRKYQINTERRYAAHNQYDMIRAWEPEDDDVLVFLDLDGDQLSHEFVLERLTEAYAEGNFVTYGQYRPIPDQGTSTLATRYPPQVEATNAYRRHTGAYGCCFNHLRTMSARVFKAMPEDNFKYADGSAWYDGGTDYVFMLAALELSGGRYKCFDEVLLDYNHANPLADNIYHPYNNTVADFLARTPLQPLDFSMVNVNVETEERPLVSEEAPVVEPGEHPLSREAAPGRYMSADDRRKVIAKYGQDWHIDILIETGTNNGDTPITLKHQFKMIHTIELEPTLYRTARARLSNLKHVHCHEGDSTEVLPQILKRLNEPAVIWLDGHCSGPGTARGDFDTPVVQELEALFEAVDRGHRHVILVDDARIFAGQPEHNDEPHYADYPTLDWIEELALKHDYDYVLLDDIVRLTPRSPLSANSKPTQ